MNNLRGMAFGVLTLIAMAACSSPPQSDAAGSVPESTNRPVPTAARIQSQENVALHKSVVASAGREAANKATDGDSDPFWSSLQTPPQWLSIGLGDLYLVDRIEIVVSQAPPGPTTHEIWLGNGSGVRILYERLADVYTEDEQILEVAIEPPQPVDEVLILTLDSPSWVGWREVKVFGSPVAYPLKLNKVAPGLNMPVEMTHAGDGSGRLYVVEQQGRIRIVENGVVDDVPFLDISDRVSCCGERGLLGLAFPPSYASGQQFYVNYTNGDGDTVISRFTTSADTSMADPESEEILLEVDQPTPTHNGGTIAFGPQDGFLYIGNGDGAIVGNIESQESASVLGKILRIDVESGAKPYSIPPTNPFLHAEGYRPEIWAMGLRNPWGFAFDSQNGDLYIPDAGSDIADEVNFQPGSSAGGENYGWPIPEANRCFGWWTHPCSAQGLTLPVAEYNHTQGCAVVGGAVYRGKKYPRLHGTFLYADFCKGKIWGLEPTDRDSPDRWQNRLLLQAFVPISSIGEDEEGNVYVTGYADGVLYEITER